jgi:hypothetical protein
VLFTSGYTDGEILRRGLLHPGAVFVQKPFAPDSIVRIVRERLDAASLRGTQPPAAPPAVLDSSEPA